MTFSLTSQLGPGGLSTGYGFKKVGTRCCYLFDLSYVPIILPCSMHQLPACKQQWLVYRVSWQTTGVGCKQHSAHLQLPPTE